MRAVAIHPCDAEDQDELSFQTNDQFCDVQQSSEDGWLVATLINTQQRGLIPSTHVQLKDEDQPPKQQQVDTPPPVKPRPKIADVDVDSYSVQQQQQSAQQVTASKKQKAPAPPIPLRSNNSSNASLPSQGGSITVSAPDFIPADRFNSYVKIFRKHDPDNCGLVEASTVKQLWSTSGAGKDSLAKVWQLVYDQNQSSSANALKPGEFIIAMHIIARLVNDKVPVPEKLPPNQLQWARSFVLSAAIASPTLCSSRPVSSTDKNAPKQQNQQNSKVAATPKQSDNNAPPSQMEMFKYATSKDGQETAAAAQKIAGSKQGQMAMKAAYDNKETLIKVAQSDQAKAAGKAAWNNKEKVGKGVVRTANMIK
ncbi:hypothetical protein MIR68_004078 [Amoeboaphelidium protococcarum]|nr:hypothetical protein MIR68_004078 [Amoeboaphelidium protococcarum]